MSHISQILNAALSLWGQFFYQLMNKKCAENSFLVKLRLDITILNTARGSLTEMIINLAIIIKENLNNFFYENF